MAILSIRTLGDPILRRRAAPVAAVTADLVRLAESMVETMYAEGGVGLAAPQVGRSVRLIVADPQSGDGVGRRPVVFFNPALSDLKGKGMGEEGCLSVPGIRAEVQRATAVRLSALDADGRAVHAEISGYLARILQHETDHINGVLFLDRLSAVQKTLLAGRIRDLERRGKRPRQEAGAAR